jgi:hypothetical protein
MKKMGKNFHVLVSLSEVDKSKLQLQSARKLAAAPSNDLIDE